MMLILLVSLLLLLLLLLICVSFQPELLVELLHLGLHGLAERFVYGLELIAADLAVIISISIIMIIIWVD